MAALLCSSQSIYEHVCSLDFQGAFTDYFTISTDLENKDVRVPVRPLPAAVHCDVFEPLDVWLRVTEHSAHKGHVAADHRRLIGRQARLQDGSVG